VLGSGALKEYVINSNTAVGSFASETLDDKQDAAPPENATGEIATAVQTMMNA